MEIASTADSFKELYSEKQHRNGVLTSMEHGSGEVL